MTQAASMSAIRKLGFIINKEDGEYRLALPLRCYASNHAEQELQAYYTTDLDDAHDTAKAWLKQIANAA